ncbi:MAG TPA: hypothetical protein VMT16_15680 [Thermoanaerobaculia bacterium]|nr:hypothetical protein [Thermoanaerobaculia bacterium]
MQRRTDRRPRPHHRPAPSLLLLLLLPSILASACAAVPGAPRGGPAATPPAAVAEVPDTEIWLAPLQGGAEAPTVGEPRNITRRPGYDNQPAFLPDGHGVLYTAIGDGQADVWIHLLRGGGRARVTATPESEFSPTPIPGEAAISVVRVESDERQRLWRVSLDPGRDITLLLPHVEPVGYHAWADPTTVFLFVLGEPPALQRVSLPGGPPQLVARDVGRSLHRIPGEQAMSYVQRQGEALWVTRYDLITGESEPLVQLLPGSEDVAWGPGGTLWCGQGSRLLRWRQGQEGWLLVADLAPQGVGTISRLAVHPKGELLAFVATTDGAE